jgi:hypothetical protein
MKAFRGTLIAAAVLLGVGASYLVLRPDLTVEDAASGPRLFAFEKHELVKVRVQRPGAEDVVLVENDGKWAIEGTDFVAGRSMVNRVKHQLHDLTARATVVDSPDSPELYGLGDNAIRVTLELRDGRELSFEAGDPNPSSVSYYIRPLPGDTIYTVKKSAVDYYSLTLDEFRERRFAGFDSKDATQYEAVLRLEGAPEKLAVERVGDRQWEMSAPEKMAANDDRMRRLLGRVSALKARDFIELGEAPGPETLEKYGLDAPRADITIRFASRDPLHLLVGADAPSSNKLEELAYMMFAGDDTIYVAKRGMLEEFVAPLEDYRNRRVVRMAAADVTEVEAVLRPEDGEDLEGKYAAVLSAGEWFWADGQPFAGSTAERLARTMAELEVETFVEDQPTDLSPYGLDSPVAQITLRDKDQQERVVLIGAKGEPRKAREDREGQPMERRYVAIQGAEPIYLIADRALRVVHDMVREGNRKSERDSEKAARRERIRSADPDEQEAQP